MLPTERMGRRLVAHCAAFALLAIASAVQAKGTAVVVVAAISIHGARPDGPGARGLEAGTQLPPFAVPLVTSDIVCDDDSDPCDANVASAACAVRGPHVLNSCELAERGPVVLAFVFEPVRACRDELDVLDRVRGRHPDVAFAAIDGRADGASARRFARAGGWKLPLAYDHDAAVADEYAVVVCPTLVFARRGGAIAESTVRALSEAEVEARVGRIE